MKPKPNTLQISNASENNLKNIDVNIPHNSLTVITGISGSGKSSLAYSVIFKESQRRFLESFSAYSRQYLGKMEKPKVGNISGLQAALAIHQKTAVANPRSTVGTMSGVYDYLRLLFARLGKAKCAECGNTIEKDSQTCSSCHTSQPKILAKLFSFNSKYGACPNCNGLGLSEHIDKLKLIADENKTLAEGALIPTTPNGYIVYSQVRVDELNKVCQAHGFSVDIPWKDLSPEQQDVIWYGSDRVKILFGKHSLESRLKWKGITAKPREEAFYKGMIPIMEDILQRDRNDNILRFASSFVCDECQGHRIRKEAQSVFIKEKNISDLSRLSLNDLYKELQSIAQGLTHKDVSEHILKPAFKRLEYLMLLGLEYLTLERESTSLSGGEAQRIRLASQVGSGLQGILYILDEPSVGLHPRDNKKMLQVLKSLRDNGNTLLVVEHDEETIKAADYLIDIGPKAGINGGEVVFQGNPDLLFSNKYNYPLSQTAQTISTNQHKETIKIARSDKGSIHIKAASKYNLKNIDVDFKLQAFNVVTGVSGAGKSTLVHQILIHHLKDKKSDCYRSISTDQEISRIIAIDQSPIGRTPRSNPATYTDLFDHIRDLFAKLPQAKERGYKKGRFSFNNKGGRCEACEGAGYIHLGMHFLGDVEIVCDHCQGKRYNEETLEITCHGKNIYEVLELSVTEARSFFEDETKITRILDQLIKLDVGYLKLGQPSTTLSGGEAQRVKLASELYKTSKGHLLYVLDEPTAGLHKADIKYLLDALNHIVENGNTVIVIEHDTDIIKQADWIVDLGLEGGEKGGNLVVQGSVETIIACNESYTGQALKELFQSEDKIDKAPPKPAPSNIRFQGITTNNLQNINIEIPINKTTVITGVSGSGKSSLAFDTIYSESRNRFTENLSSYARRMMSKVKKPELEQCSGLTPAIAIRQSRFKKNPRSTVGTLTEIYDLYRLLFSRAGIINDGSATHFPASMFSFNKPEAACPHCKGMGIITTADPEKFITNPEKSIINGAMDGSSPGKFFGDVYGQYVNTLLQVGREKGINFGLPYQELSPEHREIVLYGTGQEAYEVEWVFKRGNRTGIHHLKTLWKGFVPLINEEYELRRNGKRGEAYKAIISEINCPICKGERLKPAILDVKFTGLSISELSLKSISKSLTFFKSLLHQLKATEQEKTHHIIKQLLDKFETLERIGLGYLAINRSTSSLSGGEAQRLRIASQLVSDLCGLTYVLDEPTIGLHSRDTKNLIHAITQLQENGNTVILVEHDPEIIAMADHIVDMGPGAGEFGGKIIAEGSLEEIMESEKSVTGRYMTRLTKLSSKPFNARNTSRKHSRPRQPAVQMPNRLTPSSGTESSLQQVVSIKGARAHNLKNIDLDIPSGKLVSLTGVSGSGKSSLAFDVIAASYAAGKAINCEAIFFHNIQQLLVIDQEKIGTSPLSTAATYSGLFDLIRDLFAKLEESKSRKLKKSHFSFNSKDGACPVCKGMGQLKISMDFLSDVWTPCDACHGKRYQENILEITFKEYNINDILNSSVSQAKAIFQDYPKLQHILNTLEEIGLGYLKLGQATSTLSGGETQRLKLASELLKENSSNSLIIFDEPSTGLHMQDVERLIKVFQKLIHKGHSLLVIEHHQAIIQASDWQIDLGPDGGDDGGELIYNGE